jgi:hypothetical protein
VASAKWSPCGRYILISAGPQENRSLVRYSREDGKGKTLRIDQPFPPHSFAWAEDAESAWVATGDPWKETANAEDGILRVSFAGGDVRRLCRLPGVIRMEISPDFRWLACAVQPPHFLEGMPQDCVVVSTADGTIKPLGKMRAYTNLQWSAKGHELAFIGTDGIRTYSPGRALKTLHSSFDFPKSVFWHPITGELWAVADSRTVKRFDGKTWVTEWMLAPEIARAAK